MKRMKDAEESIFFYAGELAFQMHSDLAVHISDVFKLSDFDSLHNISPKTVSW